MSNNSDGEPGYDAPPYGDQVRCDVCRAIMDFCNDEWLCPHCGNTMMDHRDHPDRDNEESKP
jgi:hypothetical protein